MIITLTIKTFEIIQFEDIINLQIYKLINLCIYTIVSF